MFSLASVFGKSVLKTCRRGWVSLSLLALSRLLPRFLGCCLLRGSLSEDKQHGTDGLKALCGIKLPLERFPSHNLTTPCIFSPSVQRTHCSLGKPPNLCLPSQPLQMKAICNGKRNQSVHFLCPGNTTEPRL